MTSKQDMFSCLRKFASLGCYTQQRLGKKKNLFLLTKLMKNEFEEEKRIKKILLKVLFRFFHYKSLVHVVLSIEGVLSIGDVLFFCVHFICSRHFIYPRRFICPRIFSLFTYKCKLLLKTQNNKMKLNKKTA